MQYWPKRQAFLTQPDLHRGMRKGDYRCEGQCIIPHAGSGHSSIAV